MMWSTVEESRGVSDVSCVEAERNADADTAVLYRQAKLAEGEDTYETVAHVPQPSIT